MKRLILLLLLLVPWLASATAYYVTSKATAGSNNGTSWANAYTNLSTAVNGKAAGDIFYVATNHAETTNISVVITSPGTAASPCQILCTDTNTPPVALGTTATVTTTSTANLTMNGFAYCYGITFTVATSGTRFISVFSGLASGYWCFEKCSFGFGSGTAVASTYTFGAANSGGLDQKLDLVSCTINNAVALTLAFNVKAKMRWINDSTVGSAVLGSVPTTLFQSGTEGGSIDLIGVDLSALGSGKTLVNISAGPTIYRFNGCKLGASVSLTSGTGSAGQGGTEVTFIDCDSAATNYKYTYQTYQGAVSDETTIICTNNATDGSTRMSRKLVSTANSQQYSALRSDPIIVWNETTNAAINLTVPFINDGLTLSNQHVFLEVAYPQSSATPNRIFTTSGTNILATGTALATDTTSLWVTNGLAVPVKQSITTSVTPQMKGLIYVWVNLARATTTLYYGPLIVERTGSGRQYQTPSGYLNESFGREHVSSF